MSYRLALPCGSVALVDDEDVHLLDGWTWYRSVRADGTPSYVVGDRRVDGEIERAPLSRVLTGAPPDLLVDHRNGDLLDNRRKANLRVCTHAQNMRNRRVSKNNKLGLKGVCLERSTGRYRATIQVDGRNVSLGHHATPTVAARAYDRAAVEHFGEFARLNFSAHRDWLFPHESAGSWPPAPS